MDRSQIQLMYGVAAAALACAGCMFDLRSRRIPNRLTGPALLLGIAAHAWAFGWQGVADAVMAAMFAGSVFLLFYIAGGMGAGDVKLIAASASILGMSHVGPLLISTALAGALFAIGVGLARGVLRRTVANTFALLTHHGSHGLMKHPELNLNNSDTLRLPYAVAIAAGCLFTLVQQMVQR